VVRVPLVVREGLPGGTRETYIFSQIPGLNKCYCTPLYLLHRNMITFDVLLVNSRYDSTNWCKVNKNKNLIKFSCGLFCCYFKVCYSSE